MRRLVHMLAAGAFVALAALKFAAAKTAAAAPEIGGLLGGLAEFVGADMLSEALGATELASAGAFFLVDLLLKRR